MERQKYNTCMVPYMKGQGLSKEERQLRFCVGAKLCSGKTSDEEEAQRICLIPKPEKPPKTSNKKEASCEDSCLHLAHCMVDKINMDQASNVNSIETAMINAMIECQCQK